jgi:predicted component of type VI protein secretion system
MIVDTARERRDLVRRQMSRILETRMGPPETTSVSVSRHLEDVNANFTSTWTCVI